FDPHRVGERRDDPRSVGVEHHPIRHLRTVKWQRDVETVAGAARNDVHVIVWFVLPRRRSTVDDDVQIVRTRHLSDGIGQPHRHLEQVQAYLLGHVEQRLVVRAGHHQHVTVVHRLDVHEGDGVAVLVTDRHLGGAMDEIAESAMVLAFHAVHKRTDGASWKAPKCTSAVPAHQRTPAAGISLLTWPRQAKPSGKRRPGYRAISSLARTGPCSFRGGSTTKSSSSSDRTKSSSRFRAPDTRRCSPPRASCSVRRTTGSTPTTATRALPAAWHDARGDAPLRRRRREGPKLRRSADAQPLGTQKAQHRLDIVPDRYAVPASRRLRRGDAPRQAARHHRRIPEG